MFRKCFMGFGIATGLALSLLTVGFASTNENPKNEGALDGTWKLVSGEVDGNALAKKQLKGGKIVIKGDGYTLTLPDIGTVKGSQKLDPTKEPKTIDAKDANGPHKDKTILGIYELKGDEFRVAFAQPGKSRPTKFTTEADSGQWMHTWKRVKD